MSTFHINYSSGTESEVAESPQIPVLIVTVSDESYWISPSQYLHTPPEYMTTEKCQLWLKTHMEAYTVTNNQISTMMLPATGKLPGRIIYIDKDGNFVETKKSALARKNSLPPSLKSSRCIIL